MNELTPVEIMWKRLKRQGRYTDKPVKLTEFKEFIKQAEQEAYEQGFIDGGIKQLKEVAELKAKLEEKK